MKLADLNPQRRAWLHTCRWDRFIEKHEGPWDWAWEIDHADYFSEGSHMGQILCPRSCLVLGWFPGGVR
jgi:hypothetical protein